MRAAVSPIVAAKNIWFSDSGTQGLMAYVGHAESGVEFHRHCWDCKHGMWRVMVTGWVGMESDAVVDDFGDLVQIWSRRS